jgi:threonine aldolase
VRTHCAAAEALATHATAHVRIHEDASAAALCGVQVMPLGTRRGYTLPELQALVHEETCGWPRVGAVWFENTLGEAGGVVWPPDELDAIAAWARTQGRPTHLDGARLWNAHVASGRPLSELAAVGDTVSVALSKGLGAPGGSVLAGTKALVDRVRARKHAFGGGVRQIGIIAAAGLYALEHHLPRLVDDHRRARALASAIADLPGWRVQAPQTNIIVCPVQPPVTHAEQLCAPLRDAGVLCHPNVYTEVRLVVHLGIDDDAVAAIAERIVATIPKAVAALTS